MYSQFRDSEIDHLTVLSPLLFGKFGRGGGTAVVIPPDRFPAFWSGGQLHEGDSKCWKLWFSRKFRSQSTAQSDRLILIPCVLALLMSTIDCESLKVLRQNWDEKIRFLEWNARIPGKQWMEGFSVPNRFKSFWAILVIFRIGSCVSC